MAQQQRTIAIVVQDSPDVLRRVEALLEQEPGVRIESRDPAEPSTPSFRSQADGAFDHRDS
jgi:hypothetical protein